MKYMYTTILLIGFAQAQDTPQDNPPQPTPPTAEDVKTNIHVESDAEWERRQYEEDLKRQSYILPG